MPQIGLDYLNFIIKKTALFPNNTESLSCFVRFQKAVSAILNKEPEMSNYFLINIPGKSLPDILSR